MTVKGNLLARGAVKEKQEEDGVVGGGGETLLEVGRRPPRVAGGSSVTPATSSVPPVWRLSLSLFISVWNYLSAIF